MKNSQKLIISIILIATTFIGIKTLQAREEYNSVVNNENSSANPTVAIAIGLVAFGLASEIGKKFGQ